MLWAPLALLLSATTQASLVERPPALLGKIDYTVCFRDKDKRTNTTFACPDTKYPQAVGKYCYPPCPANTPNYDPDHPQHCYEECQDGYENKGNKCSRPKVVIQVNHSKCPMADPCGKIYKKNYGCAGSCQAGFKLEHKIGLTGSKCECVRPEKHYYAKHANRPYKKSPGCPEGTTHVHKRNAYPNEDLCYSDCKQGYKAMWTKKGVAMCEWECQKHTNLPFTKKGTCCENRHECKEWRRKILHDGIQVLKAHKQVRKHPDDKDDEKAMKAAVKQVAKDFLPPAIAPKCSRATDPNAELYDSDPFADLLDEDDEIEFEDMVDLRLIMSQLY